ncbi:hypothetical protein BaRGS_00000075 [Batillaria attramentaria]|uniref:Uncharacterized protein n=1 Tax=Batillaria attramentaria TaxID=370345 RepID=A0ABD0MAY9_9CAEN
MHFRRHCPVFWMSLHWGGKEDGGSGERVSGRAGWGAEGGGRGGGRSMGRGVGTGRIRVWRGGAVRSQDDLVLSFMSNLPGNATYECHYMPCVENKKDW